MDSADTDVVKREADYLSTAIIAANNLFRLDEVVLCGALAYKAERIIDCIAKRLVGNMLVKQDFRITSGQIKSKALIAAAMAIHDFFV